MLFVAILRQLNFAAFFIVCAKTMKAMQAKTMKTMKRKRRTGAAARKTAIAKHRDNAKRHNDQGAADLMGCNRFD